jgi:phage repressor protein C with HTH and peptisase S24 domain
MDTPAFPEATFRRAQSSLRVNLHDFNLIASRKLSAPLPGKGTAVAIPLLNVSAHGDPVPPTENVSLSEVKVEEVLLAPLSWCPHAEHMIAMHLAGDSMVPTIYPGSILFVDTATVEREKMNQKITVVSHRDLGFKVARLQRLANSDVLVSSNYKYMPLDISNASKWKIFGQVLWWVSRDVMPVSE